MEPSSTPKPPGKPSKDRSYNAYLQYSGMAFEMLAIIGAFTALGYFIDSKLHWKFPVATIVFSMTGLGAAFYRILKRS